MIACPQKYQSICLENIESIRNTYHSNLPIQIWEIDKEIDDDIREKMQQIPNIQFKNVADYCENPHHWKGFQVKVFALYYCEFDEAILCDADVTFFQNPEIIFEDTHYLETGTYFFKDRDYWEFSYLSYDYLEKFHSLAFFNSRKDFIKSLIPYKHENFPNEWAYIYEDEIPSHPVKEAMQESGVVYMNKQIHVESLKHIFRLNDNHEHTYQYVHGDKETFWLGCLMANQDFYFNPVSGYVENTCLSHSYRGELFWKQK